MSLFVSYIIYPSLDYLLYVMLHLISQLIAIVLIRPLVNYFWQFANLGKTYQKEEKYYNLENNFTLKLNIFYNRCQIAGLPPEAYINEIIYMITGHAMTKFYKMKHPVITF